MPIVTVQELLDAGVHFGHRTSRWNPKMKPFLAGKRNSIHIIDLRETVKGLLKAVHFLRAITTEGYDVLFVGTKRGAKTVIRGEAMRHLHNHLRPCRSWTTKQRRRQSTERPGRSPLRLRESE